MIPETFSTVLVTCKRVLVNFLVAGKDKQLPILEKFVACHIKPLLCI
jgi:hypothetical protein